MDQDFERASLLARDVTGFCFIAVDYHLNVASSKSLLLMWPKGSDVGGITNLNHFTSVYPPLSTYNVTLKHFITLLVPEASSKQSYS